VLIINADDFGMYHAANAAVIRSIRKASRATGLIALLSLATAATRPPMSPAPAPLAAWVGDDVVVIHTAGTAVGTATVINHLSAGPPRQLGSSLRKRELPAVS
jgi:hypothetical protein